MNQLPFSPPGIEVTDVYRRRIPPAINAESGYKIETKQGEIGQIVPAERLPLEVSVDQAQTSKKPVSKRVPLHLGEKKPPCVADDHVRNATAPLYKKTYLSVQFKRQFRHRSGGFGRYHCRRRDLPSIEALQAAQVRRLQAGEISVEH